MTVTLPGASGSATAAADEAEATPAYVWLFLAALVANMFSGNTQLLGIPLGLDRPLFFIAIVLLVLDPRTEWLQRRAVFVVMALTVAWTLWSWAWTGSLVDTKKAFALADRIVVPFAMFALGPLVFSTWTRRMLLLKTLTVLGIYLGITAIGEIAHLDALVWPRYISDPDVGIQYGRARGPFLYSEAMGMTAALCVFVAALLVSQCRGAWRVAGVACIGLSLSAVLLSMTRTAWISTLAAALVIGLLVPGLRKWVPIASVGLVLTLAAVFASFPSLYDTLTSRLTTERSVYDRVITNAAALKILDEHPLQGVGWGRFIDVTGDYVRQASTYPLTNTNIEIHNVFLARGAETGLPGAFLWVAAVALGPLLIFASQPPTQEMRAWRLVALAALLVWLLPSLASPNNYPLPNNIVWLVCGIAGRHLFVQARGARARTPSAAAQNRQ